jgi:2-beta-glucuronyltransferase
MKDDFPWADGRLTKIGFGIDAEEYRSVGPSPYRPGEMAAVSVGSMLFDPSVFQLAAANFPLLQFHVIGCGTSFEAPRNVHIHPEMPFEHTLPYVKHAALGIAPYRPAERPEYLADSSLKLAQFEHFGLPAVCPFFAVGSSESRIGYTPGDAASIRQAIAAAVSRAGHVQPRTFPSWTEVALQVLEPERFPEIWLKDGEEPRNAPVR